MKKIVITGMGIVSALGLTIDTFWQRLINNESGVDHLQAFDATPYSTTFGAEARAFDPGRYFSRKEIRRLSRISQMGLYAAEQALAQAGLLHTRQLDDGMGIVIGCSQGGFVESEAYFAAGKPSPLALLKPMNSAPASNISIRFNLTGPSFTVDTACSSTNHAIGLASMLIQTGKMDKAIVGGTDTVFSRDVFRTWCTLRALSEQNDNPRRACKPFSGNRDGTVLGEGAGMVILESETSAQARGATILAEVIGYGSSSDAFHITQPRQTGMINGISAALQDARLAPEDIDYINAHATGTLTNDMLETAAIKHVFGDHAYHIPISGIKAAVGHSLAASGALELIACVQAINTGILPPTINYETADPDCDLDYITKGARTAVVNTCLSNSFGFGGSNAILVLRRYFG